jgi:hypothetical protein
VKKAEATGMVAGIALAGGLLVLAAVLLLSIEGTSVKVLVAIWLWLLPALGLGAAFGWLAGKAVSSVQRIRQ